MRPIKIAPSILAYDPANLRAAVEIAEKGKADAVHLDVIDGHFAPNITFGAGTISALRTKTKMTFETHMMVDKPRLFIHDFMDAGSDVLIFHAEVLDSAVFDALMAITHLKGRGIGLALKPETEFPKWAETRIGTLSTILILTVNPGFSGQTMDTRVLSKIERVSKMVEERGLSVDIEVDGGIDADNVGEVASRGGNLIVAGAGVYRKPDPVQEIQRIRENAMKARGGH
jgi:ribulose-phosphate 3-epimerase